MASRKRALVTGSTGFIGANLARRLLVDGHEVHLVVRPQHNPWRIEAISGDAQLHLCDLTDEAGLAKAVGAIRPDWVFHLAVCGAYSWQTDARQIMATNFLGTMNLLNACGEAGFEAFINTGSSSEYGLKDHAPLENEAVDPNSYYAVSKASATMLCRYVAQSRDLPVTTLRLYSVYGPYEEPTRFVPALILRGLEGELPPLVDGRVARDFVYVEDVAAAYLGAATHASSQPGAVYNIGTGVQTTIAQAVGVAREVLGIAAEPQWGSMSNRDWDTTVWVSDCSRARAQLGWEPSWTFERGFEETVGWFRGDPDLLAEYRMMAAGGERR